MGCSSSEIKTENNSKPNIKPEIQEIDEIKEEEAVKTKINQKHNDLIEKYNRKKGHSKTVSLSNISSCFIKYWNTEKGPKYLIKSKDENILKFLENMNPFNEEINKNKDINKLQTELYETELYYSKLTEQKLNKKLQVKSSQKIHNNYNLSLKLKNLGSNQTEVFDFNNLDKPLLIIFFNMNEEKAINKIQEFKLKENELEEQEDKNFLLLPIINMFVDQYENVVALKKFRRIMEIFKEFNINDTDYYVLIKNVNEHFTHLFELEKMKQSKCIFINRNSEISLIFDEKIEYLNHDIIDFFLNTRNSEFSKDYFVPENKQDILSILENNCKKYNNLKKKYKFDVDLTVISSEKKLPIYIRFTYNEKEKELAQQLYKQIIDEIKTKIKKIFYSDYMIKDYIKEIFNLIKLLQEKFNKEIFLLKNKNKTNKIPFILNCKSSIINDSNEKSNNSNNNELCKIKKFCINYYISEDFYIGQIIDLFNLYLKETPKYISLQNKFQIFPMINIKIKNLIRNCKEVKITEEIRSSKQIKIINTPESEFNIGKNNIDVILLIDNNILEEVEQRKKINIILEALYSNDIKFILCFFSNNELDIQKLNLLSLNNFFSAEKSDIGKIIYLNKSSNESFYPFCFYTEEKFFKMLKIDKNLNLLNIYNIDLYDSNNFTISNIKNRNIFNFLLYITKKDNIDINNNNIPINNEIDYKLFKENKKKIYELLSNNEMITKTNNNKLLMAFYINFTYNKLYVLSEEDIENSKINNKKYNNVFISLTYLDYIQNNIFKDIKEIISSNNNNGKSSINIKIREQNIKTINLLPNPEPIFICPKCERSYTLDQNSFYFCNECKQNAFFCEECYNGFNSASKGKKKEEKKSKENFHEHHLILFYKYNSKKSSFIIKEKYDKYNEISKNKKKKKNHKIKCDICNNEEKFSKSNIILSHFKKKKIEDNKEVDLYINDNNEISICNKCFKSNITTNILSEEYSNNNIIFFKI